MWLIPGDYVHLLSLQGLRGQPPTPPPSPLGWNAVPFLWLFRPCRVAHWDDAPVLFAVSCGPSVATHQITGSDSRTLNTQERRDHTGSVALYLLLLLHIFSFPLSEFYKPFT